MKIIELLNDISKQNITLGFTFIYNNQKWTIIKEYGKLTIIKNILEPMILGFEQYIYFNDEYNILDILNDNIEYIKEKSSTINENFDDARDYMLNNILKPMKEGKW